MPLPEVNSIHKVQVDGITQYGVFVRFLDGLNSALLHISQLSHHSVTSPGDVVEKGEKIWVKVLSVTIPESETAKCKINVSMKYVNQGTGEDLDPNNAAYLQEKTRTRDEAKAKTWGDNNKIVFDAVLNTQCKRCGGQGHFAADCFVTGDSTKYGLVFSSSSEDERKADKDKDSSSRKKSKEVKKKKKKSKEKKKKEAESSRKRKHKYKESESERTWKRTRKVTLEVFFIQNDQTNMV